MDRVTDGQAFVPDDVEVAELESEDLTDRELEAIRQSQRRPETPDADSTEVS